MAERFAARGSPLRQTGLLVLGLAFTALFLWCTGIFIAPPNPPRPYQVAFLSFAALFFGACTLLVGRALFDVREQVVVDEGGILSRHWSETPIPWHEISRIEAKSIKRNRFLCLWLHHPEAYRSSRLAGRLAGLNRAMGYGDISVGMTGLNRSFNELVEAVDRHCPGIIA